jgi:glutathione S-transferase
MRLLYSAGSHFARLVLIALLETGLDARVTEHEVTRVRLYSPESDVLALNPVGRVPTVELDDSTIRTESKRILDYIDALNPGPKLLPRDKPAQFFAPAQDPVVLVIEDGGYERALEDSVLAIEREQALRIVRSGHS